MKVKMQTTQAGPNGVVLAGQIVDVPAHDAAAMVSLGYASYTEESEAELKLTRKLSTVTAQPVEIKTAKRGRPRLEKATDDPLERE